MIEFAYCLEYFLCQCHCDFSSSPGTFLEWSVQLFCACQTRSTGSWLFFSLTECCLFPFHSHWLFCTPSQLLVPYYLWYTYILVYWWIDSISALDLLQGFLKWCTFFQRCSNIVSICYFVSFAGLTSSVDQQVSLPQKGASASLHCGSLKFLEGTLLSVFYGWCAGGLLGLCLVLTCVIAWAWAMSIPDETPVDKCLG